MATTASECVCEAGYKRASGGASGCEQCSGREFCAVGQASLCPLNSATMAPGSSDISACQCDMGFYYAGPVLGCVPCERGAYKDSVGNLGSCQACPAGTRSAALGLRELSGCEPCPGGSFSAPRSELCFVCGQGTAAARGSSQCVPCGPGFFAASNASACTPCGPGTYDDVPRDASPGTCSACPSGKFSGALNATSDVCGECAAGSFSGPGAGSCSPCEAGSYSPRGAMGCTSCPGNSTSAGGSDYSGCRCLAGFYKKFGSGGLTFTCEECGPGEYAEAGVENACRRCPAGRASVARGAGSASVCGVCQKGSFSWEGSWQCTLCGVGSFSGSDGAGNCTDCRVGYWAAAGSSQCVACGPGFYAVGKIGSSAQCLPCPAGGYCVGADAAYGSGAQLFEACPLGSFQNATGRSQATQCTPCPANYFCPSPTLRGSCPAGTQSPQSSASQLQCTCKTGFTCSYTKVVNAVVTLFMEREEFERNLDVQRKFREAVALAAGTTWEKVRITGTRTGGSAGGGRRLLSRGQLHVAVEIEGGDGSGAGLGSELDERLGEVGLLIDAERVWIAPHAVTVRRES